jgi:hypothetical protein
VVKNWTFGPAGGTSGNPTYPYLNIPPQPFPPSTLVGSSTYNWIFAEVTDATGIPGQGTDNDNPASLFVRHFDVYRNPSLYDPSYGKMYTGDADLKSQLVDGFCIITELNLDEPDIGLDLNGNGNATDTDVPTDVFLFRKP